MSKFRITRTVSVQVLWTPWLENEIALTQAERPSAQPVGGHGRHFAHGISWDLSKPRSCEKKVGPSVQQFITIHHRLFHENNCKKEPPKNIEKAQFIYDYLVRILLCYFLFFFGGYASHPPFILYKQPRSVVPGICGLIPIHHGSMGCHEWGESSHIKSYLAKTQTMRNIHSKFKIYQEYQINFP